MLFGYLLVHNLLILVKVLSRLPATGLQGVRGHPECRHQTLPRGQLPGLARRGRVLGRSGMGRLMDLVVRRLQRFVTDAGEDALNRGMHFPVGWDPYFRDYMTRREIFHYPTQHYDHHRRQLTLTAAPRNYRPTTRPGPAGEGEAELGIALEDPTGLPSRGSPM